MRVLIHLLGSHAADKQTGKLDQRFKFGPFARGSTHLIALFSLILSFGAFVLEHVVAQLSHEFGFFEQVLGLVDASSCDVIKHGVEIYKPCPAFLEIAVWKDHGDNFHEFVNFLPQKSYLGVELLLTIL